MNKPCDERECIYERLDAFIEFAEKTNKFHDADFYKHLKKELQSKDEIIMCLETDIDIRDGRIEELYNELEIYYNPTDY